jgi:hypothetical protein
MDRHKSSADPLQAPIASRIKFVDPAMRRLTWRILTRICTMSALAEAHGRVYVCVCAPENNNQTTNTEEEVSPWFLAIIPL